MRAIGVRELKTHASKIMRKVREERVGYTITYRGKPVGVLLPLEENGHKESHDLPERLQALRVSSLPLTQCKNSHLNQIETSRTTVS